MPRGGRLLERLIGQLQEMLVHSGVVITSPELFHKEGRLVGEVDISLRGKFGGAELALGIECRDRPSDGPQGLPWIREIHGKREELGFHRMVAVSTTGFTDDAIARAREVQIDTWTVGDLNMKPAAPYVRVLRHEMQQWDYEFVEISDLVFGCGTDELRERDAFPFNSMDRIFLTEKGNSHCLEDIIKSTVGKMSAIVAGQIVNIHVPANAYRVEVAGQLRPLASMRVTVRTIEQTLVVPMLWSTCHDALGRTIGNTGHCHFAFGEPLMQLTLMGTEVDEGDRTTCKLQFYDKDLNPAPMHFNLLGIDGAPIEWKAADFGRDLSF